MRGHRLSYLYATVKTHKEVYGWRFIAGGTDISVGVVSDWVHSACKAYHLPLCVKHGVVLPQHRFSKEVELWSHRFLEVHRHQGGKAAQVRASSAIAVFHGAGSQF